MKISSISYQIFGQPAALETRASQQALKSLPTIKALTINHGESKAIPQNLPPVLNVAHLSHQMAPSMEH